MLTTILKEDVHLTMDPDSSLNRAHQKERQAERLLNVRRYEEASDCYCKAAELIKDAMVTTQNPTALFSLKLQYEANLKQPLIIKRRQEENLRKIESVTQSPPWTNKWKLDQNVPLIPYETSDTIQTLTSESSNLPTPTNGSSEIVDERFSLEEAFNSLEETRPLLECLRQHNAGDRSEYFAGALLENYDQKPQLEDDREPKVFINGRKMPKGDQMIIEELQMQNKELCQHVMRLLQNMDHCEQENQQLKSRIDILEQNLETLKSQSSSEDTSLKEDLGTPFSLPVTSNVSSLSVTTPPAEIPPLPPLELPNFDVN